LDFQSTFVPLQVIAEEKIPCMVIFQKIGDMVAVPPGWLHQVINFGEYSIKCISHTATLYLLFIDAWNRFCCAEDMEHCWRRMVEARASCSNSPYLVEVSGASR
jgi:hypothetical protein